MNEAAIAVRARGLRKVYRIYGSPLDPLRELLRGGKRHVDRVALDSVDLELRRGEIVGILGRNGAGKSTLLKVIAGTLEPSSGTLDVRGRITAILELGTGFHPDYTGRENIFMGGLCLGMSRSEIDAKIEAVIDFSELRAVIDQPFKTYSTGMQARLTFSTAISVDPDILIVDEALSVGDARFQMKCFGWIERLRQQNSTILLVSHDTNTITSFCDRALVLEQGRVVATGAAKPVTVFYHNLLFGKDTAKPVEPKAVVSAQSREGGTLRYGSREAELLDWGLFDSEGRKAAVLESGSPCRFCLTLICHMDIPDLSTGFAIKDRKGTVLWGVTNLTAERASFAARTGDRVTVTVDCTMWLAAGDYFVTLGAAHRDDGAKIDFVEDALEFRVTGPESIFTTSAVNLDSRFSIVRQSPPGIVPPTLLEGAEAGAI